MKNKCKCGGEKCKKSKMCIVCSKKYRVGKNAANFKTGLSNKDHCKCGNIKKKIASMCRECYLPTMTKHGLLKKNSNYKGTVKSWQGMMDRCYKKDRKGYKNYGGRGISVCKRWHDVKNFIEDMGVRPIGKSIDRIDNNGNYEATNCRWATSLEQATNKRFAYSSTREKYITKSNKGIKKYRVTIQREGVALKSKMLKTLDEAKLHRMILIQKYNNLKETKHKIKQIPI